MMFRPAAAELLAIARETMLAELLPLLPASARYPGLMIANAMAIAAREITATSALADASTALQRVVGGDMPADWSEAERRLATSLRALAPGAPAESTMLDALQAVTRARVSVDDPRVLPASRP